MHKYKHTWNFKNCYTHIFLEKLIHKDLSTCYIPDLKVFNVLGVMNTFGSMVNS